MVEDKKVREKADKTNDFTVLWEEDMIKKILDRI